MKYFKDKSIDEKIDFVTLDDNIQFYTHKQVEIRNGITFMRMKKRFLNLNLEKAF